MRFQRLAEAVDKLDIPCDGDALASALRIADRLAAKVSEAVGDFDAAKLWELDAATSMTAWLRHAGTMTSADAHRLATTARRLRDCPVTRQAWVDGVLSGGQIRAITANVTNRTAGLYTEHEPELVPALVGLNAGETAVAMRDWAARADALLGPEGEPDEPERRLHHSRTLAGRYETRGSFDPEAGDLIATALRLAETPDHDQDGQPRSAARRRADALTDVCRWFLDHQHGHRGGRHRPHLNIILNHNDLAKRGQGRLMDGTPLDATTTERLLCDAGIHRVLRGRSSILDYGRTTRTISPELWAALVIRDGGCRVPWCDRDSNWCDAHHIHPWHHGGPTRPDNLVLLCSRHHHRLHQPGWHLKLLPDTTIEITDPTGRTHTGRPPKHP